ncbi:MAG TPA: hypothetical protein VGC18_07970 [Lacisediminihabitans sp.]|uniref:hypothetical protein n=1 Tax=Lacisediminihabitans sp. TaxID=2787631 RepID=UPI002ED7BDA2
MTVMFFAPWAPSSSPVDASDIALTCAVVSAIQATALDAYTGYRQGKLSAEQYAGAVDTIPEQYAALTFQTGYGLRDLVAAARTAISETPASVGGAVFDPSAQPYSGAADALASACEANHTGLQIAGQYGIARPKIRPHGEWTRA